MQLSGEIRAVFKIVIVTGLTFFIIVVIGALREGAIYRDQSQLIELIYKHNSKDFTTKDKLHILKTEENRKELFVLYQYDSQTYRLAIFDLKKFWRYRFVFYAGGSSSSHHFGAFSFSQGTPYNQNEALKVIYGDNRYLNAAYFILGQGTKMELKQMIEGDNILYIYRYYRPSLTLGVPKFYDNEGIEIKKY